MSETAARLLLIAAASTGWAEAQAEASQRRGALITEVRSANADGVSEYQIANAAGVTRQTVRAWLGKGS